MAYWGSYLKGLDCFGIVLLVDLGGGGMSALKMADGFDDFGGWDKFE